jgi:hypothetical protein
MKNNLYFLLLFFFLLTTLFASKGEGVSEVGSLSSIATDVSASNNLPIKYSLEQNHPNPFNPTTTINYSLPSEGNVTLKIYDIQGNEVITLVNETKVAGYYNVVFNASNLSSGLYFYSIRSGDFLSTKKMLLLK